MSQPKYYPEILVTCSPLSVLSKNLSFIILQQLYTALFLFLKVMNVNAFVTTLLQCAAASKLYNTVLRLFAARCYTKRLFISCERLQAARRIVCLNTHPTPTMDIVKELDTKTLLTQLLLSYNIQCFSFRRVIPRESVDNEFAFRLMIGLLVTS